MADVVKSASRHPEVLDEICFSFCHSQSNPTTPGSDHCSTKSHNEKFGSLSPHPRYCLLMNSLASTAHQLRNETINADFSGLHVSLRVSNDNVETL